MTRTALVTGAARGIGHATAGLFAEQGWEVIAVDKESGATFAEGVEFMQADLSDVEEVRALMANVAEKVEQLHALVNNAAVSGDAPLAELTAEKWEAVMTVNLRAAFLLSKRALGWLRKAQGAIVNVSSVHALATTGGVAAYAASKGGLSGLTRALAVELAKEGIRVNAVVPGAVDTEMLREGLRRGHLSHGGEEDQLRELAGRIPLGRLARPDEIAQGILFLADSERSGYMTGQSLAIDGGVLAHLSSE